MTINVEVEIKSNKNFKITDGKIVINPSAFGDSPSTEPISAPLAPKCRRFSFWQVRRTDLALITGHRILIRGQKRLRTVLTPSTALLERDNTPLTGITAGTGTLRSLKKPSVLALYENKVAYKFVKSIESFIQHLHITRWFQLTSGLESIPRYEGGSFK